MFKLTKEILEEFRELQFVACPTEEKEPFFWKWTEEGKETLESFLQEVVKRAYEEGQRDLAKDIEVLTSLIPNASVLNKKEE